MLFYLSGLGASLPAQAVWGCAERARPALSSRHDPADQETRSSAK